MAEASGTQKARDFIPVENEIGRMIVTENYKYMLYDSGESREQLIDLGQDPGETRNAIADEGHSEALSKCREFFAQHFGHDLHDASGA
jgi:hypothetical protein